MFNTLWKYLYLFSFILNFIGIRPPSRTIPSYDFDWGRELIIVTASFCNFSKSLNSLLVTLVHVSHAYRTFGIKIASISLILIAKLCFLSASSLIRNFISLITPKAEFIRLLMHKSKVPLLFFKSPRYLYDSTSLITWPFKIRVSFWNFLLACLYLVHFKSAKQCKIINYLISVCDAIKKVILMFRGASWL